MRKFARLECVHCRKLLAKTNRFDYIADDSETYGYTSVEILCKTCKRFSYFTFK